LRLVVIDDGSTDDTPDALAALTKQYGGITVIRNEENQGRPIARNMVIREAGDDYLAWLDAGDLWHPRKLELQISALLRAEAAHPTTRFLCTGPLRWVFADRADERLRVPQLEGDQLHNALTGKLFPYLQGIIGKAEHFRSLKGFDERLLRRQDYDFLVRFLGSGGRMVSSPGDIPVFTYLKSDVGNSVDVVAAANRVIRKKHQQYYGRYGPELVRQVRSNQDRLVARFYRHNGHPVRSIAYRVRARAIEPELVDTARRTVGRTRAVRLPTRGVRRISIRLARPLLPIIRRPVFVDLARRTGAIKLLHGSSAGRTLYEKVRAEAIDSSISYQRSIQPKDAEIIDRLESTVDSAGQSAAPELWLQLENSYRINDMLDSAESALRRGLKLHPNDADLLVRLIELLVLRKKWAECVELWSSHQRRIADKTRSITHARVARAYRELGEHSTALAVASAGAARWSKDQRVLEEMYVSRAAVIDWDRSVSGTGPRGSSHGRAGAVVDLGFLRGGGGPIEGWIEPVGDAAPQVALLVNGTAVATSYAAAAEEGRRLRFAVSARDILLYLGDGDFIAVECEGRRLQIDGYGDQCRVTTGYESRFAEVEKKLGEGYRFTKLGKLRKGNTAASKSQILALYQRVSEVLRQTHGYVVYPFYGNLLGAVREHDFIPHDIGGFDIGYISRHQTGDQVRAEYIEVCRTLVEHGFYLLLQPWSVYILPRRESKIFVDLNYAWFNRNDELNFSYGWRHAPVVDRERVLFPRESVIGNVLVPVPGNAEEVLAQLYGPTWAIPDQGFELDAGLKRASGYLLTAEEMDAVGKINPDRVEVRMDRYLD
jgi:glycosyltransferase involved in cell wall biosynthesis